MQDLITAFVTLIVTVDPVGLAPLFLALTSDMTREQRRTVILRSILIAAPVLALFVIAGTEILSLFGITIHAFMVAGGLLIFYIAFEMIFFQRTERRMESAQKIASDEAVRNIAIFPLAIPLIAGPGAISAIVLHTNNTPGLTGKALLLAVCAATLVITYLVLVASTRIDRLIGDTGRLVLTRLLGVLLAAIAVQFVANGVMGFAQEFATTPVNAGAATTH